MQTRKIGFWRRPGPLQTAPSCITMVQNWRRFLDESGATLVEMAVCSAALFMMLLGILQVSLLLYAYHFVSDAAREGSRYAIVRGSACSVNTPNQTTCNATSAQIQSYVRGLGYPFASNLSATVTWRQASASAPTTWASCTASTANAPGNEVQVVVAYAYPLNIPFWNSTTINLSGTSTMVISQ